MSGWGPGLGRMGSTPWVESLSEAQACLMRDCTESATSGCNHLSSGEKVSSCPLRQSAGT